METLIPTHPRHCATFEHYGGSAQTCQLETALAPLVNLRALGICGTGIWKSGAIEPLADLPALETLHIAQSELTIVEAELLAHLPRLRELHLEVGTATPRHLLDLNS